MNLNCSVCGKDFSSLGALAFSPPDYGKVSRTGGMPSVDKYHICPWCWDNRILPVLNWRKVAEELLSHVPSEEEIQRALKTLDEILGPQPEKLVATPMPENPFDIREHEHGSGCRVEKHTHAWASETHGHSMRAICFRDECKGWPTHNIHTEGDVKKHLDEAIDRVRITGDGHVHFGESSTEGPW